MKKIPTVSFVFDRKHQSNSRKRGTIDLRIGYERKAKFISTDIHLLPKEWRNGIVTNRVDAIELNKSLDTLRINVQKVINDMMNEHAINLHEIPARLARLENDGKSFIDFCKERAAIRKYGRVEDSKERYNRFLRFLVSYGKIVVDARPHIGLSTKPSFLLVTHVYTDDRFVRGFESFQNIVV